MSRRARDTPDAADSFPRVSGDEPATDIHALTNATFSPRERG